MLFKTRRLFFYSLILVFIILGAYLLITAQGWVLDLKNLKVVETGSLFLRYAPSDATVEINGKVRDVSPGFITSGVLISKLAPGEYKIILNKSGYFPWEKKLTVGEAVVASASQVKLWPETWSFKEVTTSSVSDFWLTNQGAVMLTKNKTLIWDGRTLRGQKMILSNPDFNFILTSDGKNYFLTDLENPEASVNLVDLFNSLRQSQLNFTGTETPKNFLFHPFNGNKILLVTKNALYALDLKRMRLEEFLSATSTVSAATSNNEAFTEDAAGNLTVFNLLLQTANIYALKPPPASIVKMKASPSGSFIFFLENDGTLLMYDRSSKILKTLDKNAADFSLAPDEKRLIIASKNNTLSLLVLSDYYADGDVKSGDEWTLPSGNGGIKDFEWLSDISNYGLVLSGDKIFVAELEKRTPQNIYPVTDGVKKILVYGNTLYILKSNGILLEAGLK